MASMASELALSGGTPAHQGDWPSWPIHDDREREALLAVLESGQWGPGERVQEFEGAFAAFQDAAFGVACTSGTAALELALLACGIGTGDEVIVPAYTFIATATAVLKVNAIPVFVDIEPDTLNLDPSQVEAAVSSQTRAVLPVHFAGRPADMDAITAIAKKHRLQVVEDAAHAWGSKFNGKGCGALGRCGTFSFQLSKNITAGEGGIVLTDDQALARNLRALSNVGRGVEPGDRAHGLPCGNLRITEFQAAVLLAQLGRLGEQTARRQTNAAILDEGLAQVEGIEPLRSDPRANPRSYHLYIFRFHAESFGCPRERFIEALRAEGVPCHGGYPEPIYRQHLFGQSAEELPRPCPYYGMVTDYDEVHCPNAERACREVAWLKHPLLLAGEEDIRAIIAAVEKIQAHAAELAE